MEENSTCVVLENNQRSYPLTALSSYVCWYMSVWECLWVCVCVCVCMGGWRVTSCRQHMVHPLKTTDIVPSCRDGKLENRDENNEFQVGEECEAQLLQICIHSVTAIKSICRDLSLCRLQLLCYTDHHTWLNVPVLIMLMSLFLYKDYCHIGENISLLLFFVIEDF